MSGEAAEAHRRRRREVLRYQDRRRGDGAGPGRGERADRGSQERRGEPAKALGAAAGEAGRDRPIRCRTDGKLRRAGEIPECRFGRQDGSPGRTDRGAFRVRGRED